MKRCAICAHRVHVPGKCAGAMAVGNCGCLGPQAAEIPLEVAREMLARKARGRASKKAGDSWESEIINKAKAEGWMVHHVRPAKTAKGWRSPISGDPGFPDLSLAHFERRSFLLVECKSGKSARVSPEQNRWHGTLMVAGVQVRVWKPEDREAIYKMLEAR